MALTITTSQASLKAARDRILGRVGLNLEDFARAIRTRSLTADEWTAREQLEEIEFLLGDTSLDG